MKTCEELYAEMKAYYCEKTGFSMADTADLAVRLYACAAQLESLYHYADWCVQQAFPQTAVGENLDRQGQLRALSRHGATSATGELKFSIPTALENDLSIPAGVVCTTTGLQRFVTTAAGVIAAGETDCCVPAQAEEPGEAGNVPEQTITVLTLAPTGVTGCTNPAAFSGGSDAETDAHFRARILASYAALPNGANAAWYRARALDHSGVTAAAVLPRVNGVGTVGVVIAGVNGLPSAQLIAEVEQSLQAAREIAVDVTVRAPEAVSLNVTGTITPEENVTAEEAVGAAEQAVKQYLSAGSLGTNVYRSQLIAAILGTGKVCNCTLIAPETDLTLSATELAVLQSVSFTEG